MKSFRINRRIFFFEGGGGCCSIRYSMKRLYTIKINEMQTDYMAGSSPDGRHIGCLLQGLHVAETMEMYEGLV